MLIFLYRTSLKMSIKIINLNLFTLYSSFNISFLTTPNSLGAVFLDKMAPAQFPAFCRTTRYVTLTREPTK
jgi:hypothetical protein